MKLQILVPQYKEDDKVIKILLDSIEIQQGIDFNDLSVIIANDGSNVKLSNDLLNNYSYKIDYIQCQHEGVSATRNKLLEAASADYIMYCDADDMFCSSYGIWMIFREIGIGEFDVFVSKFIEETLESDRVKKTYVYHENDVTFVHGKVLRRQFLLDNNIRWNEDLTIHEDSYFNVLAQTCTKNMRYLNEAFYMWRWNENSVCRKNIDDYMVTTYSYLIDSNEALIDELIKRDLKEQVDTYVCQRIIETYYTLNKPLWFDVNYSTYKDRVEKRIFNFLAKYIDIWNSVSFEEKMKISNQTRAAVVNKGMLMEQFTFDWWIQHLVDTYNV